MKFSAHFDLNRIIPSPWVKIELGAILFYNENIRRLTKYDISQFLGEQSIKVVITEMLEDKSEIWVEEV